MNRWYASIILGALPLLFALVLDPKIARLVPRTGDCGIFTLVICATAVLDILDVLVSKEWRFKRLDSDTKGGFYMEALLLFVFAVLSAAAYGAGASLPGGLQNAPVPINAKDYAAWALAFGGIVTGTISERTIVDIRKDPWLAT